MGEKERDFLDVMMVSPKGEEQEPAEVAEAGDPPEVEAKGEVEEAAEVVTPTAATPAATSEKGDSVPLAALMAERDKRKEAQREKEDLERRIKALEAQPKPDAPDFFTDPEGYVKTAVSEAKQEAKNVMFAALEEQAKEQHPDYDEMFSVVEEQAKNNPAILQKVFESRNPAMAAYKLGKELQEFQRMQDPVAYRESLKAELLAELTASGAAAKAARQAVDDAIPPDLATERSASTGARAGKVANPVDQLFPKS